MSASIRARSGATVRIDDADDVGVTPVETEVMQGERVVVISLDGYKTWQRTLDVVAGERIELPPVLLAKADGFVRVVDDAGAVRP